MDRNDKIKTAVWAGIGIAGAALFFGRGAISEWYNGEIIVTHDGEYCIVERDYSEGFGYDPSDGDPAYVRYILRDKSSPEDRLLDVSYEQRGFNHELEVLFEEDGYLLKDGWQVGTEMGVYHSDNFDSYQKMELSVEGSWEIMETKPWDDLSSGVQSQGEKMFEKYNKALDPGKRCGY